MAWLTVRTTIVGRHRELENSAMGRVWKDDRLLQNDGKKVDSYRACLGR
jgi:hypothetical protein